MFQRHLPSDYHVEGERRADEVHGDDAADRLRNAAQTLRHALLEGALEVLHVGRQPVDQFAGAVLVEEGHVLAETAACSTIALVAMPQCFGARNSSTG